MRRSTRSRSSAAAGHADQRRADESRRYSRFWACRCDPTASRRTELWSLATYTLKPGLTRVPGVARVEVQGGRVPEIEVTVNPQRLAAFKLSLQDVEQAITQTNQVRAVGRVNRQFQQYQALVSGETTDPDQLKRVVVTQRNGTPITLAMLADIRRSVQDQTTIVTADGSEAVLLNIVRQPDANTVSVAAGVRERACRAADLPCPPERISVPSTTSPF